MVYTSAKENKISVISYGTADTKIGSGSTTPGATNWQVWNKGIIYVDVDTSAAGFTKTPVYVTSIGGTNEHMRTTGGSSVCKTTAKGFRVYIKWDSTSATVESLTPQIANGHQWHINWIALEPSTVKENQNQISVTYGTDDTKIAAGNTIPGATNWLANGADSVYMDVNTSAAGFTYAPVYLTSIGGISQHWKTTGASSPHSVTPTSFRTIIRWDSTSATLEPLNPQSANGNQWHMNWIALEPSTPLVKADQISVTSGTDGTKIAWGKTIPGATNWQVSSGNTVYVDVDTSAAGFTTTPVYVTSVVNSLSGGNTTGGSSVYSPTAKGFRVYMKWDTTSQAQAALIPQNANTWQWHIHWIAFEPSTTNKTLFPDPKKYYQIVNKKSGKGIEVTNSSTDNEATLQQGTIQSVDNQKWQLQDAGAGFYYIVGKQSGKVISVIGGSTVNGAPLLQYDKVGEDQKWRLEDAGNGYFYIINKQSDKFISVTGGSDADGTKLLQYEKAGEDQKWKFVEAV